MATETTNIGTLDSKGLLLDQSITLADDTVVNVVDYEIAYGGSTPVYILECGTTGDVHPVDAGEMGTVTISGLTKPTAKNGGSRKKKNRLKK